MTDTRQHLAHQIQHAAHLLPAQGPIGVFIHHNTLHAFEHQTFDEAVRTGSRVFGCEPYLSEDRYREELTRGRIRFDELRAVLQRDLGEKAAQSVHGLSQRLDLRLAMLQHPLRSGDGRELDWFMAETDALMKARRDVAEVERRRLITETRHWVMRRLRGSLPDVERPAWIDDLFLRFKETRIEDWSDERWEAFTMSALWEVCREGVRLAGERTPTTKPLIRHRDLLSALGGMDSDLLVNDVLIRFCSAFLDQGIAHWALPERDAGFFASFCALHEKGSASSAWWMSGLKEEVTRLQRDGVTALACIEESLAVLGAKADEVENFLSATFLALRGWGGMIWHVEQRADRVHHAVPEGTLTDFLAVRLLLERFALQAAAKVSLGYAGTLAEMREKLTAQLPSAIPSCDKQRAFLVFQLAQVLGWTPEQLFHLETADWVALFDEAEGFDELERRRVFHLAYEHRFRVQTLDALASRKGRSVRPKGRASFQAVFCIDEREESIRRHVEEVAPTAETFGAAGFFGVVMYYRGAAAADFTPLCPVVVRPQHWVSEVVDRRLLDEEKRRSGARRRLGMALTSFHGGSRRIVSGAFFSAAFGLLATVPLVARVVFPRLTARFRGFFGSFIAPPPVTRLKLERSCEKPSPEEEGHGFLPQEMISIAERILRDIGLTANFSRVVLVFGHGSTSMNNPHESAHDCGACGGGVGGPNARAIAEILNDSRIRTALKECGIEIPADTVFIGGLHNTANDNITFSDVDRVPPTHQFEFEVACKAMTEAVERNAHERARRFGSAPLGLTQTAAKRHMEGRSEDLSQVRPEWGHATNAICIVGRREKTRGLFLDRRAFLVSYDPAQDDAETAILARILGAVVPVCSGINLEYYFSYVDSPGWGSGSKLPHNITGLLGVMDGAMSDLRTGLPWQMVEIHEPVRLLFVIETTAAAFLAIMEKNEAIKTMVTNAWVQIALMDPSTGALSVWHEGQFEPYQTQAGPLPVAASSKEWYTGWRDHLEFAEIVAALPA
ncbi:MAG: DUF2309 domain-containing protein [Verrucomicrobiaceae bacterium]|nr:DUF2309 domain-containing protein [Verrucomicrobiaceae bacterium]